MSILSSLTKCHKALYVNPKNSFAYGLRGNLYSQVGDLKSAILNVRKALVHEENSSKLLRHKRSLSKILVVHGMRHLFNGNFLLALDAFEEALGLDNLRASIWLFKSIANVGLERYEAALLCLDHCVLCGSRKVDVFILRAKLRLYFDKIDLAHADFNEASTIDPNHPQVLLFQDKISREGENVHLKATQSMLSGHPHNAVEKISSYLDVNPDDQRLRLLRAAAYRQCGSLEASLSDIDHVAKQEEVRYYHSLKSIDQVTAPSISVSTGFRTGSRFGTGSSSPFSSSMMKQHFESAETSKQRYLTCFDMAVREFKDNHYTEAMYFLEGLLGDDGIYSRTRMSSTNNGTDGEAASSSMNSENNPMREKSMQTLKARGYILRADCNRTLGRYQLALADYNLALETIRYINDPSLSAQIFTRFSLVHNEFGRVLFNRGRYTEAAIEFSFAQKYSPNVSAYALNIGVAEYYTQRFDRAYECFKMALELDPNNDEAKLRLSQFSESKKK
eukprot:g1228.t1